MREHRVFLRQRKVEGTVVDRIDDDRMDQPDSCVLTSSIVSNEHVSLSIKRVLEGGKVVPLVVISVSTKLIDPRVVLQMLIT